MVIILSDLDVRSMREDKDFYVKNVGGKKGGLEERNRIDGGRK
jgi:hypothetical protein